MNEADWLIVSVVGLSSLISLWRGFVKEAMSLLVWASAFIISMLLHDSFAYLLKDHIQLPAARSIVAITLLFLVTLVIGSLITRLISMLVRAGGLSGADRVLGVVFGFLRGVILVVVITIFLPAIADVEQWAVWRESVLIPELVMLNEWSRSLGTDCMKFVIDLFDSQ